MSNLLQIRKMTFLCDKHYMQGTIVAMAAKMPEVILTEYGLLASSGLVPSQMWIHEGINPQQPQEYF